MEAILHPSYSGKTGNRNPPLVARICGTCSNAHLLASLEAVENALTIKISDQTLLLRKLIFHGLIIRDHSLHLYIFALPDVFKKNSILDFDMNDPVQHEFLDDAFAVKEVGNQLSIVVGEDRYTPPILRLEDSSSFPN